MPNRRQTLIWINAVLIHWHIYAALGRDDLTLRENIFSNFISCTYMYEIPLFTDDIIQNGRWDLLRVNPMGCSTHKRQSIVPHWGRDQIAAFSQATYSKAFSWMKMYTFPLRFHWSMFPMVQLTIFQHWCRQWLGTGQATSRYMNQWCLVYWHIYRSLCPNELRRFLLHVIICESD